LRRATCIAVVAIALLPACKPATTPQTLSAGSQAAVFVYLQPFPAEASRLKFRVESLTALTPDGARHLLDLELKEGTAKKVDRERLLAGGHVPAGAYSGLSLKIASASLQGKGSQGELRIPEEDVRIDVPFKLTKRQAVVVSLRIHYPDSVASGFAFTPDFSAEVAGRAPAAVLGIVTSCSQDRLTLFDKLTGRVSGVVPVGRSPRSVVIDSARLEAFVAVADEDLIEVIDLQQSRSIDRIQLFGGDSPVHLALSADGSTLLVVNEGSNTLSVVDPAQRAQADRITVGERPSWVTVDAARRRAYVFNTLSDSVSVVDLQARRVVATVVTDPEPFLGRLDRSGSRLFVIHRSSPHLTVIDTLTLEIPNRVWVGPGASALESDPNTDRVYLARTGSPGIDVYDPFSLLPVETIPAWGDVGYLTIDAESNNLGLVLPRNDEVRLLRIVGGQTVGRIDVGENPCWLSFSGER